MNAPLIVVIVVHFGPEDLCLGCLESVKWSAGVRVSPVIVDHNPTPSAVIRDFAFANEGKYISNPANPGFAAGANAGLREALREARPDSVVVMNPDVRLEPACLRTLHDVLAASPDVGLAGPGLLGGGWPERWWNVGSEVLWPSGKPRSLLHGEPRAGTGLEARDTGFVCGSVLALRPDVVERIGFLPEGYFLYFEDAELSFVARSAGLRTVVCPGAVAWHSGSASSADRPGVAAYYRTRNRLFFSREWNPRPILGRGYRGLFAFRALAKSFVRYALSLDRDALLPARAVLDYFRQRDGKLNSKV